MNQSFFSYNKFKYLKYSFLLMLLSIGLYLWHSPALVPNGGTWLGYGLGTVGALMIVWLMWLGVRKRQYASSVGSLRGWLSAHVYLGIGLLVIVTLHTGFQLGLNVHTLSYVLMVLVILSGLYGTYVYLRYPQLTSNLSKSLTREQMLMQLEELDQSLLTNASKLSDEAHKYLLKIVNETTLGGGLRGQFFGQSHDNASEKMDKVREQLMQTAGSKGKSKIKFVAELSNILSRRSILIEKINLDIQYRSILGLWLYFHIPMSFALLAALIVHIITVFFYW